MAILCVLRFRNERLIERPPRPVGWPGGAGQGLFAAVAVVGVCVGCEVSDPALVPDEYLQAELGLTADDRVHTIALSGGAREQAEPGEVAIASGDFVQFKSTDWFIHEVAFELDSLGADSRAFLTDSGQEASPPLLQKESRFVLSFRGAPPGRYPYVLTGNSASGSGVLVVRDPDG